MSNTTQFACVHCGYAYTKANNTNKARCQSAVRRQRECLQCHRGFVTYEVTADDYASLQAVRKLIRSLPKDAS
jgi:transcriptional regulator NrdR family protein